MENLKISLDIRKYSDNPYAKLILKIQTFISLGEMNLIFSLHFSRIIERMISF